MGPRTATVAGLFVGVSAAVTIFIVVLIYAPEPVEPPMTAPTATAPSAVSPSIAGGSVSSLAPPPTPSATAASPSPAPSASGGSAFHIGEPAPPLVVPQVGGGTIDLDLAARRGVPVWVNFMATWCPPCQDEFPLMNGFFARYGDTGLLVVAIDVKEDEGLVSSFAASLGATFPLGLDLDGRASATWGAFALPVHFWIDADGIVRDGALGGIGADVMAEGLRKILPGVDVTP